MGLLDNLKGFKEAAELVANKKFICRFYDKHNELKEEKEMSVVEINAFLMTKDNDEILIDITDKEF